MGPLKLGVHQLPSGEAGLVRALLVLMANGHKGGFPWIYSAQGPYDAVIRDGTAPPLAPGDALRALSLVNAGASAGSADTLERPLRAEQLEAYLLRVASELATTDSASIAPRPDQLGTPVERYKLRRWPPNELLRANAERVRLATLLSRRPLSLDELARIGQTPLDTCRTFVRLLQGFELLEASTALATPRASQPAASAADRGRWLLVRSLRDKLGLNAARKS